MDPDDARPAAMAGHCGTRYSEHRSKHDKDSIDEAGIVSKARSHAHVFFWGGDT